MIKTKRRNTIFTEKKSKAIWKVDSNHSWDYEGESKVFGTKYKSTNYFINKSNFPVNKFFSKWKELSDA